MTQYSSSCCFVERGKEIVMELTGMMAACLKHYHTINLY